MSKILSYRKAYDQLRIRGTRLMLMHTSGEDEFFVIPGGQVSKDDAKKLLSQPDLIAFDDGLFPNNPQSWRIATGGENV